MKFKEIKEKKTEELQKLISEKREGLRKSRFGSSGSRNRNVKEASGLKKDVARILTEMKIRKDEGK